MKIKKLIREELHHRFREYFKNKIKEDMAMPIITKGMIYFMNKNKSLLFHLKKNGVISFTNSVWLDEVLKKYNITFEDFYKVIVEIIYETTGRRAEK